MAGANHREPHVEFDYAALDAGAEEIRELRAWRERIEARAGQTLETVTDFLFAGRLSPRELLARLAALGIASGHWKLRGKGERWIAGKFGLSQSAVARAVRRTGPKLRLCADLSEKRSDSPPRMKKRRK